MRIYCWPTFLLWGATRALSSEALAVPPARQFERAREIKLAALDSSSKLLRFGRLHGWCQSHMAQRRTCSTHDDRSMAMRWPMGTARDDNTKAEHVLRSTISVTTPLLHHRHWPTVW